jgi:DNA-binding winged helix-turn-helix (wHTH) protein
MLPDPVKALAPNETKWRFGSFVLWEVQRRLEWRGERVRLGARSFDLLMQLVRRPGEIISNEQLLASVWSGVVVEEASVRVHMSILRKALGSPEPQDSCREWIINIPLRGYCFVGRVYREFDEFVTFPAVVLRESWQPWPLHVGLAPAGNAARWKKSLAQVVDGASGFEGA